ncbi:hypothetical protein [Methylorubrum extorquens]|uniref:hypothetical protein n=1 Tax=Methylorubrum extorquens TaxID=408 RepID=UPI001EE5B971|nr:hypothetical protein [Methylorubrum extorquens]MCG5247949.1 hypothetical protein [Methylorubrum extorquens]
MSGRAGYFDIDGQPRPAERLDAQLSNDTVCVAIEQGAQIGSHGVGGKGTWEELSNA